MNYFDVLLASKLSGGKGTKVIANPEGEATDDLVKIEIDGTIYNVDGDLAEVYNDIANAYDSSKEYKFGDYVIYNRDFYSCIEATTGEWKSNAWKRVTIAEILDDIKTIINPLIKDIGIDELAHLIQTMQASISLGK